MHTLDWDRWPRGEHFVRAAERVAAARVRPSPAGGADRDDLLFMTAIPWLPFTAPTRPLLSRPPVSIPRFAWGRLSEDRGRLTMPSSVQGPNAPLGGMNVARTFEGIEALLAGPEDILDGSGPEEEVATDA